MILSEDGNYNPTAATTVLCQLLKVDQELAWADIKRVKALTMVFNGPFGLIKREKNYFSPNF